MAGRWIRNYTRKMKEQDLIDLGFERIDVSAGESGDKAFYYYTYDFTDGFSLITNASDEKTLVAGHYRWVVDVFNTDDAIRFVDRSELEQFINIVNRNKKDGRK